MAGEENDDERVWCLIHLHEVESVLQRYELWKDGPWYHAVNWSLVSRLLAHSLGESGAAPSMTEMWAQLGEVPSTLTAEDRAGLSSLIMEPITVSPVQLTNGGHRLKAMHLQGVNTVPGMFHRGDIGVTVRADRAYPPRTQTPPTVTH